MKILISTIVRNRINTLSIWKKQIIELSMLMPEHEFHISVYENDSVDGSKQWLKDCIFPEKLIKTYVFNEETLNTVQYGSIKNNERVHLLAKARNKSIFQSQAYTDCEKIICIEPDIFYNPQEMIALINSSYDIISPCSINDLNNSEYHMYDRWGTRNIPEKDGWTDDIVLKGIIPVWTTFNCFCVYKSEPIRKGAVFDGFNTRLNIDDCDTAVICEKFRELGYQNIVLNADIKVYHPV